MNLRNCSSSLMAQPAEVRAHPCANGRKWDMCDLLQLHKATRLLESLCPCTSSRLVMHLKEKKKKKIEPEECLQTCLDKRT